MCLYVELGDIRPGIVTNRMMDGWMNTVVGKILRLKVSE